MIVVLLPVVAVAVVCPFTSNPFLRDSIGSWLISPAAQEIMFAGYLYGLLATVFPGTIHRRLAVPKVVVITAALFVLWHTPNFLSIPPRFAAFQMFYTFWGGICFLLARRWTGSILPGIASHMGANFFAWAGW
jgi:membrane protease YdiL (CAAX protease family)